ncbi:uncharacterized protein C14orf93 homolog [Dendronephthya gigantea]|uniref:uncharacterized protein C14orf93 homolog n=1 Tax=Dendronephthya gigantea TaxID=151771 RepID=UPI00106955A4|nr:uncharacterized protein C14orf93 homolog [Dendronephthya gigantea]
MRLQSCAITSRPNLATLQVFADVLRWIGFYIQDDVRLLHNQQDHERQFNGSQGVGSAHYNSVKAFLLEELVKENSTHSKATISGAISRYYETKRVQFLDNLPERREAADKKQRDKKMTSGRRRLFLSRLKIANEAEKERIREVGAYAMSDEEDGKGAQNGSWIVRSAVWRSPELNKIIWETQLRLEEDASSSHPKNKRINGPPSSRIPPPHLPNWPLKANFQPGRKQRNLAIGLQQDGRHCAGKEIASKRKVSRTKKASSGSRRKSVRKETTSAPPEVSKDPPTTSCQSETESQLARCIQSDESDQDDVEGSIVGGDEESC